MTNHYFKFQIPFKKIHEILINYENIIFYIDISSIARGLYNKRVILMELEQFFTTQQLPETMFNECRVFYNNLYKQFKQYNPKFVTIFDDGTCLQNTALLKNYKSGGSSINYIIQEDIERDLYYKIRQYYFERIEKHFNKPPRSYVVNLYEYESDLIPYYIIKYNLLDSQNLKTLNVILSTDKDLAQTCQFLNTIQCATLYKRKTSSLEFNLLYDNNAISYFYKKFKRGSLTSKYIPLILAIAGDKADKIDGLKNVGYAKAIKVILYNNMKSHFNKLSDLPLEYEPFRQIINTNYKVTSFNEQIKRLPLTTKYNIETVFKN